MSSRVMIEFLVEVFDRVHLAYAVQAVVGKRQCAETCRFDTVNAVSAMTEVPAPIERADILNKPSLHLGPLRAMRWHR